MKCVCVSPTDEVWYRGVVSSAHLSPPVHATVKLIDCGRMEDLPLTRSDDVYMYNTVITSPVAIYFLAVIR